MRDKSSGEEKFIIKIRGIPIDYNASARISFDGFKAKTLSDEYVEPVTFEYDTIQPNQWSQVTTKKGTKRWEPYCLKGVILVDHRIIPFGYQ